MRSLPLELSYIWVKVRILIVSEWACELLIYSSCSITVIQHTKSASCINSICTGHQSPRFCMSMVRSWHLLRFFYIIFLHYHRPSASQAVQHMYFIFFSVYQWPPLSSRHYSHEACFRLLHSVVGSISFTSPQHYNFHRISHISEKQLFCCTERRIDIAVADIGSSRY